MIEFERGLSAVLEKYQVDFRMLLQDPLFTRETDGTKQMITATDILHGKRDKILLWPSYHSSTLPRGRFSNTGNAHGGEYSLMDDQ
jgi:hypothetical protein